MGHRRSLTPPRALRRLTGAAVCASLVLLSPGTEWSAAVAQVVAGPGEAAAAAVPVVPAVQAPLGLSFAQGAQVLSLTLAGPAYPARSIAPAPEAAAEASAGAARRISTPAAFPAAPAAPATARSGPVVGTIPARDGPAEVSPAGFPVSGEPGRNPAPAASARAAVAPRERQGPRAALEAQDRRLGGARSDSERRSSLEAFFASAAEENGPLALSPDAVATSESTEAKIAWMRRALGAALEDPRFAARLGRLLRAQRIHTKAMDLEDGRIAARLKAALGTLEIRFSTPKEAKIVRGAHAVYVHFPYGADKPYILFNSDAETPRVPSAQLAGVLLHELIHHEFGLGESTAVRAELLYYAAMRRSLERADLNPDLSPRSVPYVPAPFDGMVDKLKAASRRGELTGEILDSYGPEKMAQSPDDRWATAKHHLSRERRVSRVADEIQRLMESGRWNVIADPAAWVRSKLPRTGDAAFYLSLATRYLGRGRGPAAVLPLLRADLDGSMRAHAAELAKARLGGTGGASGADAAPAAVPAAAAGLERAPLPIPAPDAAIDPKTAFGLFSQRSLSIVSFIAVTIAFPFAAVPVVGWTGFGILMALSPIAGITAGPISGIIVDRMSTRTALVLNTLVRVASLLALPAFHYFGVLNFGTLLVASMANGWLLSSIMTSEGAFMRRLFPAKALETVNGLLYMNYLFLQVVLGLLVGIGRIVDQWNPFAVFAGAAAVNLFAVLPLIWFFIPNVAPPPAPRPAAPATAPRGGDATLPAEDPPARRRAPFLKKYWKESLLFLAAAGVFALFTWMTPVAALLASHFGIAGAPAAAAFVAARPALQAALTSPLPVAAALLLWIARTGAFAALWNGDGAEPAKDGTDPNLSAGRLRTAMIFMALGALMMYPLQYFGLPHIADLLAGTAGKGLLLGQFLGSLFFGNLVSTAAQAKLPSVRLPGLKRPVEGQRIIQAAVVALAAAWVFLRLIPGSLPAAAAAAAVSAGLMAYAQRLTNRGWVKLIGAGFAAVWLPFMVWTWPALLPFLTVPMAMYASLILIGMSYGPSYVSLISYFQANTKKSEMGKMVGVQGAFFNSAISIGYAAVAIVAALLTPAFPATLAVLGAAYLIGGYFFWRAPRRLPGLPETIFKPKPSAEPSPPRI